MENKNLNLQEALAYIKELGVDYGDIRIKDILTEQIKMENGKLTDLKNCRSRGAGVRVYVDGKMGFAASSNISNLKDTVKLAYDTALTSSPGLVQVKKEAVTAQYATKIDTNPFDVPIKEKLNLLTKCNAEMAKVKGVCKCEAFMHFSQEDVTFADTDGSLIQQVFYLSGGGIVARAGSQWRSYGNSVRAGYEAVLGLKLLDYAGSIAKEVVALSAAQDCPKGDFDIVMMPNQLSLQIHESVGHPTELDRVLGSELAFAGGSFLSPDDAGLVYGSSHMTVVEEYDGYDDEGVMPGCVVLVDKGKFKNFQTTGLAEGWGNLPIVRMTNINLQPGSDTLDGLISGIKDGFLVEENKSWSIDDKRVNFQFSCEIAREIKDGKLTGKIFKNPTYTGNTTEFWGSLDGVCNEDHRQMVGVPNCGKGQPMQIMYVGHASCPARFRNVRFV